MADKRIIKELKIIGGNTKANVLRLTLEYRLGGWNYFTGEMLPRGLFLSCSPLEVVDGWTGYVGFSGVNKHVLEMKRFSKKTLAEFVPNEEDVNQLIRHVAVKNQLEVES